MLNTCQYRVKELIKHHTHLNHQTNSQESHLQFSCSGNKARTPRRSGPSLYYSVSHRVVFNVDAQKTTDHVGCYMELMQCNYPTLLSFSFSFSCLAGVARVVTTGTTTTMSSLHTRMSTEHENESTK